ncbi:uracil-DNA glycosylase [Campylobacter sp. RM16187]|uniref:uracil-DNA glycosylase n=1 Tax=Campylobacter sp. RM16187 TaxID=1660063 RepID=UPI0021B5778D|nr:uracil-DNA glycosylase [Campylobacter sp. RM16187]QKG29515.1 uracil-DNA glycosylase family protein [Campylobacter sp. RM16187]
MIYANEIEILRQLHYLKAFGYRYINPSFGLHIKNNVSNDIKELEEQIKNCNLCELCKSRNNALVGSGRLDSKIMFISDTPSVSEDISGRFLEGSIGEKFCKVIYEILGLNKHEFYMTSIIKCKIHQNNLAINLSYELCKPYLMSQIDIISPKIIVALGENVFLNLINNLERTNSFESIRGNVLRFKNSYLMATYSPAWVLKNPSKEQALIDDLNKIKGLL